ncbi:MAG: DUF4831 family protein [Muribaculaceae bacterium]|nr:DUF4831 family protein [Muribaculaceae bacterium]MDE7457285.1 DUF4831 family protein [Muribaculaceae bacterium]
MKTLKTLATIAITSLISLGVQAQTTQRLNASKANDYGLIYSLPRTLVDITIETEHTEKTPGDFYNYAKLKLGINDAITKPSRSVTVKSVTITPRGVADPDNRWLVQFKAGATPYVILDDNNCPVAVNTDKVPQQSKPALPEAMKAKPTPLETEAASQAITQEMTLSSSLSKRADLAAQRIFELRETRSDLISGQADNTPPDGKSMQLALDNLSAQEAALTAMFAGTTKSYTSVSTITFEPDSESVNDEVFVRLSPVDGIVDANDLSGAPIYISVDIVEQGNLPLNDKGEPKTFPKGGLAYNIPGRALITLSYDGRQIASEEVSLAQLGVTFGLDPKLFSDKKEPSKLLLDPTTGAITLLGPADE